MVRESPFLVVGCAEQLVSLPVKNAMLVTHATSCAAGITAARDSSSLSAVVIDMDWPRLDVECVVAEIRRRFPGLPMAMVATDVDHDSLTFVHRCGAQHFLKSDWASGINSFVDQVALAQKRRSDRVRRALRSYGAECGLSPRELEVLTLAVGGLPRAMLATELQIAENTVKHHTKQTLAKTGCESLAEVVRLVLLRATNLA